jgi:hypothetical protein
MAGCNWLQPTAARSQETDSVNAAMLEHGLKVNVDANLLDPKQAVTSYDDLFTGAFVR